MGLRDGFGNNDKEDNERWSSQSFNIYFLVKVGVGGRPEEEKRGGYESPNAPM